MPANEPGVRQPGRTAQLLSLCLRAGKLVMGFDPVKEAVLKGKACLLAASLDASQNTRERMRSLAEVHGLPLILLDESLDDLWYILGKRVGVLGITDSALARKVAASREQELSPCHERKVCI